MEILRSVSWPDFANTVTAIGLVLAIIVFVYQIRATNRDRRHQRSEFALNAALTGYEEAYNLLKDGSNDRVVWISAARSLSRGRSIANSVTDEVHIDLLSIHVDKYRRLFGDILGFDNPKLRAGFFYGAHESVTDIDKAAEVSTRSEGGQPSLKDIPEAAIWTIFESASFPDDYGDPLQKKHGFEDEFIDSSINMVLYPALHGYLSHRKKFRSVGGKLIERERAE